jgi:hypothetical protein
MNWNRIISAIVALVFLVVAFVHAGAAGTFKLALFLIIPLACIWFSEELGGYVGPAWGGPVMSPTPGIIVCIVGWLLLFLPVLIWVIYAVGISNA